MESTTITVTDPTLDHDRGKDYDYHDNVSDIQ